MQNSDYWKLRFSQLEEAQNNFAKITVSEIEKLYVQAQKQIESQIAVWYQRLARNNGITLSEARQFLKTSDLKEFKWDVEEYIKYGKANAINKQWVKELENASAKFHISKLEALKIHTRQSLEELFQGQYETRLSAYQETCSNSYFHTAYELQKGFNIGFDISGLNQSEIKKIISKPWAADGYNFSERIWHNKTKLINEVHLTLTQSMLTGFNPQKAIDTIAKKMKTSKTNAGRLVMTENAFFSSLSEKKCFDDLGVEQYEILATLDSRTSEICQNLDGKVFNTKDFQAGVTAPPFHVNCRSTTVPYFDKDYGLKGERAARDEDGETYYVPSDMNYPEWKKVFVDGDKSHLTEIEESGIINAGSDTVSLENQRYGRNKDTLVNKTYIESGEYRRKFDKITKNKEVNRIIYSKAKEMLKHRTGTMYEDMYWIDMNTGDIIASALDEKIQSAVTYSESIKKSIQGKTYLLSVHTHPHSMPPSAADFNSAYLHKYAESIIICHDGKIFKYFSNEEISVKLCEMYIQEFIDDGYTEYEAQIKALEKMKENHSIDFMEVE